MRTGSIPKLRCLLPLFALLTACGGVSFSIAFSTVERSVYSGVDRFQVVVVSDPITWAGLWNTHTSFHIPGPPLPTIDFSSRIVVGVFLGPRPNGCYAVHIDDIQTVGNRVLVYFSERRPFPGEVCTQVITTPAHLATINRTGLIIEFVKSN